MFGSPRVCKTCLSAMPSKTVSRLPFRRHALLPAPVQQTQNLRVQGGRDGMWSLHHSLWTWVLEKRLLVGVLQQIDTREIYMPTSSRCIRYLGAFVFRVSDATSSESRWDTSNLSKGNIDLRDPARFVAQCSRGSWLCGVVIGPQRVGHLSDRPRTHPLVMMNLQPGLCVVGYGD